jgi:hypothetical protein
LRSKQHEEDSLESSTTRNKIRCVFNEIHCVPSLLPFTSLCSASSLAYTTSTPRCHRPTPSSTRCSVLFCSVVVAPSPVALVVIFLVICSVCFDLFCLVSVTYQQHHPSCHKIKCGTHQLRAFQWFRRPCRRHRLQFRTNNNSNSSR